MIKVENEKYIYTIGKYLNDLDQDGIDIDINNSKKLVLKKFPEASKFSNEEIWDFFLQYDYEEN